MLLEQTPEYGIYPETKYKIFIKHNSKLFHERTISIKFESPGSNLIGCK